MSGGEEPETSKAFFQSIDSNHRVSPVWVLGWLVYRGASFGVVFFLGMEDGVSEIISNLICPK